MAKGAAALEARVLQCWASGFFRRAFCGGLGVKGFGQRRFQKMFSFGVVIKASKGVIDTYAHTHTHAHRETIGASL